MTVERLTDTDQLKDWRAAPGSTAITIDLWPHHQATTVTMVDHEFDRALRDFEKAAAISGLHQQMRGERAVSRQTELLVRGLAEKRLETCTIFALTAPVAGRRVETAAEAIITTAVLRATCARQFAISMCFCGATRGSNRWSRSTSRCALCGGGSSSFSTAPRSTSSTRRVATGASPLSCS
jgi:hypothetical protein